MMPIVHLPAKLEHKIGHDSDGGRWIATHFWVSRQKVLGSGFGTFSVCIYITRRKGTKLIDAL